MNKILNISQNPLLLFFNFLLMCLASNSKLNAELFYYSTKAGIFEFDTEQGETRKLNNKSSFNGKNIEIIGAKKFTKSEEDPEHLFFIGYYKSQEPFPIKNRWYSQYFTDFYSSNSNRLFKLNINTGLITPISNIALYSDQVEDFIFHQGKIFFAAASLIKYPDEIDHQTLYVWQNGSTIELKNANKSIYPYSRYYYPSNLSIFNGKLYFSGMIGVGDFDYILGTIKMDSEGKQGEIVHRNKLLFQENSTDARELQPAGLDSFCLVKFDVNANPSYPLKKFIDEKEIDKSCFCYVSKGKAFCALSKKESDREDIKIKDVETAYFVSYDGNQVKEEDSIYSIIDEKARITFSKNSYYPFLLSPMFESGKFLIAGTASNGWTTFIYTKDSASSLKKINSLNGKNLIHYNLENNAVLTSTVVNAPLKPHGLKISLVNISNDTEMEIPFLDQHSCLVGFDYYNYFNQGPNAHQDFEKIKEIDNGKFIIFRNGVGISRYVIYDRQKNVMSCLLPKAFASSTYLHVDDFGSIEP